MGTDKELYNHLLFEFNYFGDYRILTEKQGVFDDTEKIINKFLSIVSEQLNETFNNKTKITKTYNKIQLNNTIFGKTTLVLTTNVGDKITYRGKFEPTVSMVENEKGNIECNPFIELNICAPSENKLRYVFCFSFGHELTHAYNLFCFAKKFGIEEMIASIQYKQNYSTINNAMFSNNTNNYKAIANMLYKLNRMERNAYIAQLKQELLNKKSNLKNTKTTFETIKETESYKKFLSLEDNIKILSNITDVMTQNEIINAVNTIMGTFFSNYAQVKKYLINRWNKWRKKYIVTASKIAYNIFDENNPIIDGKNMNNDIMLKP